MASQAAHAAWLRPSTRPCTLGHWTMDEAVQAIGQAAEAAQWRYAITPNAAHFARLQAGDAHLAAIYASADFCFLDSRVIALLARLAGLNPPPVVTGAGLVEALFTRAIKPASTVCVVGGSPEAVGRLQARFAIAPVRHLCPSMGFWRHEAELSQAASFVADSGADYSFLCVGSPQQEVLADRIARTGRARGVGICAGASIDFLTGLQKRAPRPVRRLALEWAWRLAAEPRRMARRYLIESPRGIAFALGPHGGLR